MIVETKINKEYHANGKLAYLETVCTIAKGMEELYSNRRNHPDGYSWIRTGLHQKYFDNGQLHWELQYDNLGALIKTDKKQYRKDGTVVEY